MSTLSEQAFSVYCDEVVRDVVQKDNELREQNAALEPLRNLLHSLRICAAGVVSKEVNLLDYDNQEEDDEYLSYSISDFAEFPLEEIHDLSFEISGVSVKSTLWNLDNLDGITLAAIPGSDPPSAALSVQMAKHVRITGIVTNFPAHISLAEVQRMTECSNYKLHVISLGLVPIDSVTLAPRPRHEHFDYYPPLEGTMFRVTDLEIRKSVLQPALSCSEPIVNGTASEELEELQTLAQANSNHERLFQVVKVHKNLVYHNATLKECRNLLQSFEVEYSDGVSVHFKLEAGRRVTRPYHEEPLWCLEPLAEENSTLSLSNIGWPIFRMANVPIDLFSFERPLLGFSTDPGIFLMLGGRFSGISTFFLFDDALDRLGFDALGVNFTEYVSMALEHASATRYTWNGGDVSEPDYGLTMKLTLLQVPMPRVAQQLRLLGIDTNASD